MRYLILKRSSLSCCVFWESEFFLEGLNLNILFDFNDNTTILDSHIDNILIIDCQSINLNYSQKLPTPAFIFNDINLIA